MKKGKYRIEVLGGNLENIAPDNVYVNIMGYDCKIEISDMSISDSLISYDLSLQRDATDIEFCILNNNGNAETVEINEIHVYTYNTDRLDSLKNWFR